jgi:hypothetical protein
MRSLVLLVALLANVAFTPAAAAQAEIGSPTIARPLDDASSGVVYVYRGTTQPLAGPNTIDRWSFFDDNNTNGKVTPLIFERTGANAWVVVAIGTTRTSTGVGVQSHAFEPIAGTGILQAGKTYTIGFTHRAYTGSGANVVAGAGNAGVVDFDGYNNFTDLWSYSLTTAQLGTKCGTGGNPLDGSGSAGRIYSMKCATTGIGTVTGCQNNPADLAIDVLSLSPGTAFELRVQSPNFADGFQQVWYGVPSLSPLGCGIALPGLGEAFILPGTQVLANSGFYSGGAGYTNLSVPPVSALVGAQVLMQGVAVGVFATGTPLELTNGLLATIVP